MKKYSLNGSWNLYYYHQKEKTVNSPEELILKGIDCISAEVPGNVELDLINAGILPKEIFKGNNPHLLQKYEKYDWWYETEFDTPEADGNKVSINFGGVDCYADYWLNGKKIASSENMLIPTDVDVTDHLNAGGKNKLYVHIRSALYEAAKLDYPSYPLLNTWDNNNYDGILTRKPPHAYGWDIMPRVVTSGLWKDVDVVVHENYDIKQLYIFANYISEKSATINVAYELDTDDYEDIVMDVKGKCGDSEFTFNAPERFNGFKAFKRSFKIENPKLWWPYGYGEANLYDVTVTFSKHGKVVAEKTVKLGIRSVELKKTDTTDGKHGNFEFYINGTPIMCKGSNWVPLDAFHSQDYKRLDKAMELVGDIGCNILRCWGGNVYESEEFYNYCDKMGVMIWQDFSMACHGYPQDEWFQKLLKEEAVTVIKERRQHPCIILWSGDNECDGSIYCEGNDPNDNILTREVLRRAVAENDIGRPYLPSSPFISEEVIKSGDLRTMPEDHLWGSRDYYKSPFYAAPKCHFVSETGYHGCPSLESVKKFIDEDHLWPLYNNPQWNLHSTDTAGRDHRVMLMEKQVRQLFGEMPESIEDFIFASQISQAEAKKFFVENIRTHRDTKKGVIWWNLLDGWPQMSDAVVDYYFDKKIAYDYIKRSQQPFALMCTELYDWVSKLIASNDTREDKNGTYKLTDIAKNKVISEGTFVCKAGTNEELCEIPLFYSEQGMLLIEWEIDGKRYVNHYLYGFPGFDLASYKEWYSKIK